ncbi:hypothetical protein Rcae01_01696 [Novipirellula caenicola]|uniref:Outer membrane efflux protein n=1 Tax=Novipirellula caenicola TaxID=1536901 RepID=A0ABP9VM24_9BACT
MKRLLAFLSLPLLTIVLSNDASAQDQIAILPFNVSSLDATMPLRGAPSEKRYCVKTDRQLLEQAVQAKVELELKLKFPEMFRSARETKKKAEESRRRRSKLRKQQQLKPISPMI